MLQLLKVYSNGMGDKVSKNQETNEKISSQKSSGQKKSWRRRLFIILILVIVIIIAYQTKSAWNRKLFYYIDRHLPVHAREVMQLVEPTPLQLQDQVQKLAAQNQQLQSEQQAIQMQLQQLRAQDDHWSLADATYLTRLANYQLLVNRNPQTAIKLLQTADSRLASLNNIQYQSARTLLARDIVQLQALPILDINGIIAQLMALSSQVSALAMAQPKLPKPKIIEPHYSNVWQKFVYKAWHELRSLVIIRHLNQPIAQLLTDDQQASVNQHIISLFQQAQWAVLHQNQTIYQASLSRLQDDLHRYFMVQQSGVQSMLANIKQLVTINVEPNYPDLSRTVAVIQALQPPAVSVVKPTVKMTIPHRKV